MAAQEEEFLDYLNDHSVLQRLLDVLKDLIETDPLPVDPLMEILHAIGCPLIPQEQMKVLERQVSRAYEEMRQLRCILIDLGREEDIYESDTDENDYVGEIGEIGTGLLYSQDEYYEEYTSNASSTSPPPSPLLQEYTESASIAIKEIEEPLSPQEEVEEEEVEGETLCSVPDCINVQLS